MNNYIKINKLLNNLEDLKSKVTENDKGLSASQFSITKHLVSYNKELTKVSVIIDYFVYQYDGNINKVKKNLKLLCKNNNITQYDLCLGYLVCNNSVILAKSGMDSSVDEQASDSVYIAIGFLMSKFLMYTALTVYGDKIPLTGEHAKFLDGKTSHVDIPRMSMELYNSLIIGVLVDSRGMEEVVKFSNKDIKRVQIDYADKVSVDTFAQYVVCTELSKKLLGDMFAYYIGKYNLMSSATINCLSENATGEAYVAFSRDFMELLRDRDFLIPTNGIHVSCEFERQFETINDIRFERLNSGIKLDVFERQLDGDNYLICIDTTCDFYTCTIINLSKGFTFTTGPALFEIGNRLLYLYGLDKSLDLNTFPIYASFTDESIIDGIRFIRGTNDFLSEYNIEIPYYWRYRGKNYTKSEKVSKGERINMAHSVYIGAYKRKLPNNASASEEAKAVSKLYCINLKEDETLVRPQIREYK